MGMFSSKYRYTLGFSILDIGASSIDNFRDFRHQTTFAMDGDAYKIYIASSNYKNEVRRSYSNNRQSKMGISSVTVSNIIGTNNTKYSGLISNALLNDNTGLSYLDNQLDASIVNQRNGLYSSGSSNLYPSESEIKDIILAHYLYDHTAFIYYNYSNELGMVWSTVDMSLDPSIKCEMINIENCNIDEVDCKITNINLSYRNDTDSSNIITNSINETIDISDYLCPYVIAKKQAEQVLNSDQGYDWTFNSETFKLYVNASYDDVIASINNRSATQYESEPILSIKENNKSDLQITEETASMTAEEKRAYEIRLKEHKKIIKSFGVDISTTESLIQNKSIHDSGIGLMYDIDTIGGSQYVMHKFIELIDSITPETNDTVYKVIDSNIDGVNVIAPSSSNSNINFSHMVGNEIEMETSMSIQIERDIDDSSNYKIGTYDLVFERVISDYRYSRLLANSAYRIDHDDDPELYSVRKIMDIVEDEFNIAQSNYDADSSTKSILDIKEEAYNSLPLSVGAIGVHRKTRRRITMPILTDNLDSYEAERIVIEYQSLRICPDLDNSEFYDTYRLVNFKVKEFGGIDKLLYKYEKIDAYIADNILGTISGEQTLYRITKHNFETGKSSIYNISGGNVFYNTGEHTYREDVTSTRKGMMIPMQYGSLDNVGWIEFNEIMDYCMNTIAFSENRTKMRWYQYGWGSVLVQVVVIAATIATSLYMGPEGMMIGQAILSSIEGQILGMIISRIIEAAAKVFNVDIAIITTAIALYKVYSGTATSGDIQGIFLTAVDYQTKKLLRSEIDKAEKIALSIKDINEEKEKLDNEIKEYEEDNRSYTYETIVENIKNRESDSYFADDIGKLNSDIVDAVNSESNYIVNETKTFNQEPSNYDENFTEFPTSNYNYEDVIIKLNLTPFGDDIAREDY